MPTAALKYFEVKYIYIKTTIILFSRALQTFRPNVSYMAKWTLYSNSNTVFTDKQGIPYSYHHQNFAIFPKLSFHCNTIH